MMQLYKQTQASCSSGHPVVHVQHRCCQFFNKGSFLTLHWWAFVEEGKQNLKLNHFASFETSTNRVGVNLRRMQDL